MEFSHEQLIQLLQAVKAMDSDPRWQGERHRWERPVYDVHAPAREKAWVRPHGVDGLLSAPGVNPYMPSALRQAEDWGLPMFPSIYTNNRTEIFTALDAMSGDNADDFCDTPPTVGNLRVMQINRQFGKWYARTNQLPVPDLGQYADRADINRFVLNGLIASNPFTPDVVTISPEAVNTAMGKELLQMAEHITQQTARVDYVGDATTVPASAEKGFTKEYDGLEVMIKTGYVDAVDGATTATAVDSIVTNFNADITSGTFVTSLIYLLQSLVARGVKVRLPDTLFEIHIPFLMKEKLIEVWACNYQTARCDAEADGGRFNQETVARLRDEMMRGNYLLVDGVRFPIKATYAMPTTFDASTSKYTGDIMVVPLYSRNINVAGRIADGVTWLTYREYLPMANAETMQVMGYDPGKYRTMNNGLYIAKLVDTNMCENLHIAAQLRLQLDFPFLAGRLDNVAFSSNWNVGSPYTTDTDYKGGGVVDRS